MFSNRYKLKFALWKDKLKVVLVHYLKVNWLFWKISLKTIADGFTARRNTLSYESSIPSIYVSLNYSLIFVITVKFKLNNNCFE